MLEFLRRLHFLLHRRRLDRELAGELEFHREMAAREGRAFLHTLHVREQSRDAWGWAWLERFGQDLRFAARLLRRSPGFTLSAVLTLAIGIGVNVAAFGFLNMLFLRALPVRDPDSLLRILRRSPNQYASSFPYPEVAFFAGHGTRFSAVLAACDSRLRMEGEAKPVTAAFVTSNYHSDLGATARLGRILHPARDPAPGGDPPVVLSYGFWRRHFGGDPTVVGRTVLLGGKAAYVVGVMAREFSGLLLETPDVWIPLQFHPEFVPGSRLLTDFSADRGVIMWGRLLPGVTPAAALEELRSLAARLREQHPEGMWENESPLSQPGGYTQQGGGYRGSMPRKSLRQEMIPFFALAGALVLLILAVSCSNLGSLLLARGVARQREIAIRVAIGAGNGRLVRQLFTESLLLGVLGTAAGLALGWGATRFLLVLSEAPEWLDPTPDWRVLAFASGIGMAAALLFGLAPALQVARQRHRARTMKQFLVGAQVAASCILLIVASLLVRSVRHATSTGPGFAYQRIVSVDPDLALHGYTPAAARAYLDTLAERLRGVPGVASVSLTATSPLGTRNVIGTRVEGEGRAVDISVNRVDPEFLATLEIPLLRGRGLIRGDTSSIVVSESLARRLWPGADPLGKELLDAKVAGVARSARVVAIKDPDSVELYQLPGEEDLPNMVVLVRTAGAPEGAARSIAAIARSIDPQISPVVQLLNNSLRLRLESTERSALAVSLLGFVALALSCLGVLGLVNFAVSQRTREIGIRMALGAAPGNIVAVVLRQFAWPVTVGLCAGVAGAAGLSQLLRRELYGLHNLDPLSYVSAVVLFVVAAGLAMLWPASRALRVDPIRALRQD
jgi:predicted permease